MVPVQPVAEELEVTKKVSERISDKASEKSANASVGNKPQQA